jgi:type IV secretion system protein VirD4
MVSRQESARALLTPGEVMQLPPGQEVVMVSGHAPVRAQKLRYFEDANFQARVLPPPLLTTGVYRDRPVARPDDWSLLPMPAAAPDAKPHAATEESEGGLHRHPEIGEDPERLRVLDDDLTVLEESSPLEAQERTRNARQLRRVTRLSTLDPSDGLSL